MKRKAIEMRQNKFEDLNNDLFKIIIDYCGAEVLLTLVKLFPLKVKQVVTNFPNITILSAGYYGLNGENPHSLEFYHGVTVTRPDILKFLDIMNINISLTLFRGICYGFVPKCIKSLLLFETTILFRLTKVFPIQQLPKLKYLELNNVNLEGEIWPKFKLPRLATIDDFIQEVVKNSPKLHTMVLKKMASYETIKNAEKIQDYEIQAFIFPTFKNKSIYKNILNEGLAILPICLIGIISSYTLFH